MMPRKRHLALPLVAALFVVACSSKTTTIIEGAPPPGDDAGAVTVNDAGIDATSGSTTSCTAAREKALVPIASVSKGAVSVVAGSSDPLEIYVDATAGGFNEAASNPRVYIKLDGTKASLTDEQSYASTAWDLALRRTDIFTNSGDAGPGQGGAVSVQKAFDAVTAADAAHLAPEQFFDASCQEILDDAGFLQTTFSGWYDYDTTTNVPSANPDITFVVKSADGTLYKLQIVSNTGKSDGTTNATATANYLLKVKKL